MGRCRRCAAAASIGAPRCITSTSEVQQFPGRWSSSSITVDPFPSGPTMSAHMMSQRIHVITGLITLLGPAYGPARAWRAARCVPPPAACYFCSFPTTRLCTASVSLLPEGRGLPNRTAVAECRPGAAWRGMARRGVGGERRDEAVMRRRRRRAAATVRRLRRAPSTGFLKECALTVFQRAPPSQAVSTAPLASALAN